ncbi:MAG TPA: quinolinate synthase [Phycisphaerales bacterium]|nr:quinolinate synthase [Phycisphaerales bacterium]
MLWQPALPEKYQLLPDDELASAIEARRQQLGSDLLILGHHYQQDEVVRHADLRGDSLKLSHMAAHEAKMRGTKYIVFCGVHFMAETADVLAPDSVRVILPDLSAGCSMADMAALDDTIEAWNVLHEAHGKNWNGRIIPITYVNSSAAIKAFVGAHGGACCTSSNADAVFRWALAGGTKPQGKNEEIKVLFLPDQHLGRNTAKKLGFRSDVDASSASSMNGGGAAGISISAKSMNGQEKTHAREGGEMLVWNPRARGDDAGGVTQEEIRSAQVYLWAGHCSVHKLFRPEHVHAARERYKDAGGVKVLVHPECCQEVVDLADLAGSTEFIIKTIENAPAGSRWMVATEIHLVMRIAREAKKRGVEVHILSDCQCLCTTMYRIDPQHLLWVLDNLVEGKVVNEIVVDDATAADARLALERMLENTGGGKVLQTMVD